MPSVWDDDKLVEQLTALYEKRLSCSQIAHQLGRGISRNAVIGRLNRMGLRSIVAEPRKAPPPRASKLLPPFPEPPQLLPPLLIDGQKVTLMTLAADMCKWPISDSSGPDMHFCAHPPKANRPYCEFHCSVAFVPLNPAKRVSDEDKKMVASLEIKTGLRRAFGG